MSTEKRDLSAKDRQSMDDSDFAYVDSNGGKHLPINDADHVHAAMGRWSQQQFETQADKVAAAKKIVAAAKKFGMDVDPTSDIAKAAGVKAPESKARFRNRSLAERRSALHTGCYERRTFDFAAAPGGVGLQVRSNPVAKLTDDNDTISLVGYAIRYGVPYEVHDRFGTFTEEMRAGAVTDTLQNDDPVFMYDHNSLVMGRKSAGTLRVGQDDHGVPIEVDLSRKQHIAQDLAEAIRRGDVKQMSVGFIVPDGGDTWNSAGTQRKISKIQLLDVSAVGIPASPTTSIALADNGVDGARKAIGALRKALSELPAERLALPEELRALGVGDTNCLAATLDALHQADDYALPIIALALQQIDEALDDAQCGISDVLGVDDPDGGPDDQEITLTPAPDEAMRARDEAELRERQLQLLYARKLLLGA